MPSYARSRKDDKIIPSPVTPAVTGIDYPSNDDASTELESYKPRVLKSALYTHPNIAGSTIDDVEPPADARSLDQLWGTIRLEKERKMAKERPKVQSLEDARDVLATDQPPMQIPVRESSPPAKSAKKQKSISNFRESTDGRAIVANFDLPEVDKQDIHITFQRNRLILTWQTLEVTEWEEEDGVILREQFRNMYHRTLPLPEGTRFEEVHAQLTNRGLTLRFPNMKCYRVDARSGSGDS
ncbi:hypothetical protein B0H34DRAFT_666800 [Crassisporium funariophilum]|nr:hypothetical protein B0H34DRAFT_666800 [Crassisporium funariophilum]